MTDTFQLPYLVQRCMRRDEPSKKGLDALFSFDYMGATEFEVGLFSALKLMRAAKNKKWKVTQISIATSASAIAYYVGAPELLGTATAFFEDQLKPRSERRGHLKESSYLYEAYFHLARPTSKTIDAWWAIEANPPFVLFKQKDHAETWLEAL